MSLNLNHRRTLNKLAISDKVIESAEISSVSAGQAAVVLNWPFSKCGGVAFPQFSLNGEKSYSRVRLDVPFGNTEFMSPTGSSQCLYIPPLAWQRIQADERPIVTVVGELNALSVLSIGYPVIGLPCFNVARAQKSVTIPPDRAVLENLALEGREVVLIFDSHSGVNLQVNHAKTSLQSRLVKAGAQLHSVLLPMAAGRPKRRVADFIAAAGDDAAAAFEKLIE